MLYEVITVLALTALLRHSLSKDSVPRSTILGLGLFGACLLYGDGMITPAISVLSAVEGLRIITPTLEPFVIPTTVAILIGLFSLQRSGTARIGRLFGPIMLLWFSLLALLGLVQIIRHPQILAALAPWYGLHFLLVNKLAGFIRITSYNVCYTKLLRPPIPSYTEISGGNSI